MSSVALHPAETFVERMREAVVEACARHKQREIAEVVGCNASNISIALGRETMRTATIAKFLDAVEVLDRRKAGEL